MGVCSSCLGLEGHSEPEDSGENARLLNDNYQNNYGGTTNSNGAVQDPEEVRKQREALERLCAQASDNLIDISHYVKSGATNEETAPLHKAPDFQRLLGERISRTDASHLSLTPRTASIASAHDPTEEQTSRKGSSGSEGGHAVDEVTEESWLLGIAEDGEADGAEAGQGVVPWDHIVKTDRGLLTFKLGMLAKQHQPVYAGGGAVLVGRNT